MAAPAQSDSNLATYGAFAMHVSDKKCSNGIDTPYSVSKNDWKFLVLIRQRCHLSTEPYSSLWPTTFKCEHAVARVRFTNQLYNYSYRIFGLRRKLNYLPFPWPLRCPGLHCQHCSECNSWPCPWVFYFRLFFSYFAVSQHNVVHSSLPGNIRPAPVTTRSHVYKFN